jgi:WD40 repeat protein
LASYDPEGNRLVIFGGVTRDGFTNDVWVLSHANGLGGMAAWSQIKTSGEAPSPRHSSLGAYNASTNRLIVFGGTDGPLNDTWVLTDVIPDYPPEKIETVASRVDLLIAGRNGIKKFDGSTGKFLADLIPIDNPVSVLTDNAGRLYVTYTPARAGPSGVRRYDAVSGALIDEVVPVGSGDLRFATDTAIGPDGTLYVASSSTHSIKQYDIMSGRYLGDFIAPGSGGLVSATGLAFGPNDAVYVSSSQTHSVKRYNAVTGAFIDDFVAPGSGGLRSPLRLRFGPNNRLCVIGFLIGRTDQATVFCYDTQTGAFVSAFRPPSLLNPTDIAFGPDRNAYVTSSAGNPDTVYRFSSTTGVFSDIFVKAEPALLPQSMLFLTRPR